MTAKAGWTSNSRDYRSGLDRIQESVISSHFMHRMSRNPLLDLYGHEHFIAKAIAVDRAFVVDRLAPILLSASATFCEERVRSACARATERWREYGHTSASTVGISEFITEAVLDKEFSRNGARYNDRKALNRRIKDRVERNLPIEMVIPALPFKIPSPLKSRGPSPDLGEVNFLLSLYEIANTIDILYRAEVPNHPAIAARFTVVADGSRFNEAINKSSVEIRAYQARLSEWTDIFGLREYIRIIDYRALLQERLPSEVLDAKAQMLSRARAGYSDALWPIFDAGDMDATFQAAVAVELDPEEGNPEGRFVSLLKSLVYTMNYKSLGVLEGMTAEDRSALYRELTAHIFQPYAVERVPHDAPLQPGDRQDVGGETTTRIMERLRCSMLREVWSAAIQYIAEIKSDRDLVEDPILTCLPGYLRWTIHAKQGQLAIATPPILGVSAQAWAGSAVFRLTSKRKIRLCSLPALMLEGAGAIPVTMWTDAKADAPDQPLFYIDEGLNVGDLDGLLAVLDVSFTRRRFS